MIVKSYLAEENINLIFSNLSLIYGENLGLVNELRKKIINISKDKEIFNMNQSEVIDNKDQFIKNVYNYSLFSEKKIFFINQCNDKILNIIEEIELKLDNQKIVVLAGSLEKKSKLRSFFEKSKKYNCVPCYEDNENTLRKIISQKLQDFNGINLDVINLLISNCNQNRSILLSEIDKIKAYFQDKIVKLEPLFQILNIKENDKFNNLRDRAISGDKVNTNQLLGNSVLDQEKYAYYISIINERLNRIKQYIELSNKKKNEDILSEMRPPIFWKDKPIFLNQIKKWNQKKIINALNRTFKLEIMIKSKPNIKQNILIKKAILDICNLANAS